MVLNKRKFFSDLSLMFTTIIAVNSWNLLYSGDWLGFFAGANGVAFVLVMLALRNGVADD
ncbi:MAG TPA: hypothetical protein V6C58_04610 [Allocoleopsis sp.]